MSASRQSPPKSPASEVSLRDKSLIPVRGAGIRHTLADPSTSRIPRLRLSESPPKTAKITETQHNDSDTNRDPPSSSEESLVVARNLRRNANDYLRSAVTASGHTCPASQVVSLTSQASHPPEPGEPDTGPQTFIVSASPDIAVPGARDDLQPVLTTETDPQLWDNNAITPEQEPDHQQDQEINSPTMYQSTVRQILTPYRNFYPQPDPNITNSSTTNNDRKCDEEEESENKTVKTSQDPELSGHLIRRSSGPENDEYITLNINSDFTHAQTIDPEPVGNTSEKNKQQKNVEKFSHLEPIYECFSSGNA